MKTREIPIHDFSRDDESSIPFEIQPLEVKTHYDSSVPHRHNYYEIFIFGKEGGDHEIDFTNYGIETNGVHFVSPGQVHHVRRELGTFGHVILFSRDFFSTTKDNQNLLLTLPFLNNSDHPVINLTDEEMAILQPLVDLFHAESKNELEHAADILRSTLRILLMHCDRFHASHFPDAPASSRSASIQNFRLQLEQNFMKLHKVKDYAGLMGMSEKSLNEAVKQATGKTVSGHIYERLILEAKRLLRHSELSTKEIAYALNFNDPSHFSKFFKTRVGKAPSEFKK